MSVEEDEGLYLLCTKRHRDYCTGSAIAPLKLALGTIMLIV